MGLKLNIGALGPSITEQLAAQGWSTSMPAATLDRYEHAIHLLRLHGLLTDAESDRAFKRLIKDLDAKPARGVPGLHTDQQKGGA